ncbi:MAG: hypothetical protein H0S84_11640 [Bacteroidales bacterium]|jgi:hypothetical protein|nr:hypothetical protein [Bacteroidales bacterium]MDN5350784.1 hypothetical protein [Bacteroidales bacterium]
MAKRSKSAKRRRRKFKTITFKLTEGQYKSLSNYCKARKTTPIKLIKSNIGRFITAYTYDVPPNFYVTENQLELFHEE